MEYIRRPVKIIFHNSNMIVVDCPWEIRNLGKKVLEITIEPSDEFDINKINDITKDSNYIVIKVPMNMPLFNFGLAQAGYIMIETQITLSKKMIDFPFEDRLIKHIYPYVNAEIVETDHDIDDILKRVTPNMFSSDRIYLDPTFTHEMSCVRYKNWIKDEYEKRNIEIIKIFYGKENVGFSMGRNLSDGTHMGLLGGIYEDFQSKALGIISSSIIHIYYKKENRFLKQMRTNISSNNEPVFRCYNYLNYNFEKFTYVFVKHTQIV